MASRKTIVVAAAMALVATAALLPAAVESKKRFTVGDAAGWNVGVDYVAWASGKKFKVGDTLVFKCRKGQDVVLVDEQSFDDCKVPDNVKPLGSDTEIDVALGQAPNGKVFFICDAKGACQSGMKLAINVTSSGRVGHYF